MNEKAGDVIFKAGEARFIDGGGNLANVPSDTLTFELDLAYDGLFISRHNVLVGTCDNTRLIDGELEEHGGVSLFLLGKGPHSDRQPVALGFRDLFRAGGGSGFCSGRRGRRDGNLTYIRIGQSNRFCPVSSGAPCRLAIDVDCVTFINDGSARVIDDWLGGEGLAEEKAD